MKDVESTLMYNWFQEVWNKNNRDAIDALLTDDVITHGLSENGHTVGKEAYLQFYDGFQQNYTDIQVTVEDVIQNEDTEIARCRVHALHTASGKPLNFTGICIARFVDGKIAEAWNEFNFLAMYQQLGFTLAAPMAV